MTDKFTIRDILAYTILGLVGLSFLYLHCPNPIIKIIISGKDYSDLVVLLIIPISYLAGHLIMSVDDIIFNGILYKVMPKDITKIKGCWKFYNFLFFGYRNMGLRNVEKIKSDIFIRTCDKLRKENAFGNAEYFQVMSDLFKGVFLVIFTSIMVDLWSDHVFIGHSLHIMLE